MEKEMTIRQIVDRAGKAKALAVVLGMQIENRESDGAVQISEPVARDIQNSLEEYRELILEMRIEF